MLRYVWTEKKVKPDQLKLLAAVRVSMNIDEDLHNKLEDEVKAELHEKNVVSEMTSKDKTIMVSNPTGNPKLASGKKAFIKIKLKKYLTLGKEKLRQKDYNAALEFFLRGQELDPNNGRFQFLIKKTKLKLQQIEREKSEEDDDAKNYPKSPNLPARVAIPVEHPYTTSNAQNTPALALETQTQVKIESKDQLAKPAPAATPVIARTSEVPKVKSDGTAKSDDSSKCVSCGGTGTCYWCNGTGKCDRCNGTGTFNNEQCTMCNSSGKCNSCTGKGSCMWCKGSGKGSQKNNRIYTP